MIYFTAADIRVLVLEPENIERLKQGRPAHSPDNSVFLYYTPDSMWLAGKVQEIVDSDGTLDVAAFESLVQEGLNRPTVFRTGPELDAVKKVL